MILCQDSLLCVCVSGGKRQNRVTSRVGDQVGDCEQGAVRFGKLARGGYVLGNDIFSGRARVSSSSDYLPVVLTLLTDWSIIAGTLIFLAAG